MESDQRNNDKEIQEWSRHYDRILWQVNAIFLAAIGALLVYVYDKKHPASIASIFGLALILFVLFYVSGFRVMRENLHNQIEDPKLRKLATNPYGRHAVSQWHLFVLYMSAISAAFVGRLWMTGGGPISIYLISETAILILVLLIWRRGRHGGKLA